MGYFISLLQILFGLSILQHAVLLSRADEWQAAHQTASVEGFPNLSYDETLSALQMNPDTKNLTGKAMGVLEKGGYSCSKSKPCKIGCCGPRDASGEGTCGAGPKFCGKECSSQCNWKSECDPGWGREFSKFDTCSLNVCCSPFGFCGISEAFCHGHRVTSPPCPGGRTARKRIIGYYQAWNLQRPCGSMTPEEIPMGQYTHINFAFAYVDPESFKVIDMNNEVVALYKRLMWLKATNPDLQVWIAIAGGSLSPWPAAFSDMASEEVTQDAFIDSLVEFLTKHGFDGVDLNWEYPVIEETGGKPNDFESFVTLCQRLRQRLESSEGNYGLSITLPTSYRYLKEYDIKGLVKHIDWFNFMTYDFHGKWDKNAAVGQYAHPHTNLTELQLKLEILWRNNIDPGHVVMGLGFYGRSFTLKYPDCKAPGCPFIDVGEQGECTATPGILSAHEIKELIKNGAEVTFDKKAAVKTVTWHDDQWVSYDDAETVRIKHAYANSMCLGGTMIWAIDLDDHAGTLIKALGS